MNMEVKVDNARAAFDALLLEGCPTTELDFLPSPEEVAEAMSVDELLDYINLPSERFFFHLPASLARDLAEFEDFETEDMFDALDAKRRARLLAHCQYMVASEIEALRG